MNLKEIKELLALMQDHDLAELEIEKDGSKIKLKRGMGGRITAEEARAGHPVVIPMPLGQEGRLQGAASDVQGPRESADVAAIRSPMVGTYYAAPAPDQPPYVVVGQAIKPGDVLCIIEAMKLMNEIKSDLGGTLAEILAGNGQPVEFDQVLFKIKKG